MRYANRKAKKIALVILNPLARGGTGKSLWNKVLPNVQEHLDPQIIVRPCVEKVDEEIKDALAKGIRMFVAAGGDGTVHQVINSILEAKKNYPLADIFFGAVGLGSSNDFHKPYSDSLFDVPLRIDSRYCSLRDVGFAEMVDLNGKLVKRFFLISGSLGFVAWANDYFNSNRFFLSVLKKSSTNLAILYSAFRTLRSFKNQKILVSLHGRTFESNLTNLSVSKTPYVGGCFRYDSEIAPDNGILSANIAENLSWIGIIKLMKDLSRGKFLGKPHRHHFLVKEIAITAKTLIPVELDGEIFFASAAKFRIHSEKIRVCNPVLNNR
ncbi:hypothetical protein HYY75_07380 [bacterium]|nr:hypothetical protein [bacterium]